MKNKFVFVAFLGAILSACSTPYQPDGFRGGYSDTRIGENRYLVSFSGNGFTSEKRVQKYLLYRCAEVAVQSGYDYFLIAEGGVDSSTSYMQTQGNYSSTTTYNSYGRSGRATTYGTYTPGHTTSVTKYGGTVTIILFKEADKPNIVNIQNAHEVLKYIGPDIER